MTTEVQDIELPNGDVVQGVPVSYSKAQLLDMLSTRGDITVDQATMWGKSSPSGDDTSISDALEGTGPLAADNLQGGYGGGQQPNAGHGMSMGDAGAAVMGNLDVPGGIAGSMGGAKAGAPFGPYGVLAGTVLGGVGGTFGGEILSDYFMSNEPDISEATKNAAISGGVELVTLGAASKFKGAMKLLGFNGDEIGQLWKTYTTKKPKSTPADALPVGSEGSLLQTQNLLESGGGTLRAYQTGQASLGQRISEGIGEVGIVSKGIYEGLDQRNAKIVADKLQQIADETTYNPMGLEMGPLVGGIIDAGKDASGQMYNAGLKEITEKIGTRQIQPKWFVGQFDRFRKSGQRSFGSDYSPKTLKYISKWQESLKDLKSMSIDDMLAMQRKMNDQIRDMGKFGESTTNRRASKELAELSQSLRTTTEALLRNTDEVSYNKYKALNAAYGEAQAGLLPKLNANIITRANKGDYESIAKVLEGKNPDQIAAFYTSIDTAFNSARMAGMDMAEATGVATAQQAKDIIRTGWVKNVFGEVSDGFNPGDYTRLAKEMEKPAQQRAAKEILGKDWPQFKALLNAMNEMTAAPQGQVGSLVIRSKEAQAVGNLASGAQYGATGAAGVAGGFGGAAAILLTPVVLAKAVTRPGVVRAILEGNKKSKAARIAGKTALASKIMEQTTAQVLSMFSEEDQAEIRQEIRGGQ